MFDSWIQNQSQHQDKQNHQFQQNSRYDRMGELKPVAKKNIAKEVAVTSTQRERAKPTRVEPEIKMIKSKTSEDNTLQPTFHKNNGANVVQRQRQQQNKPATFEMLKKSKQTIRESQQNSCSQPRSINFHSRRQSQKSQKQPVNLIEAEKLCQSTAKVFEKYKSMTESITSQKEDQLLIGSHQNIALQITSPAPVFTKEYEAKSTTHDEVQKKRYQEARNVLGQIFKQFNRIKNDEPQVPTFTPVKQAQQIIYVPKINIQSPQDVGYSFASNNFMQNNYEASIKSHVDNIPNIPQILSERIMEFNTYDKPEDINFTKKYYQEEINDDLEIHNYQRNDFEVPQPDVSSSIQQQSNQIQPEADVTASIDQTLINHELVTHQPIQCTQKLILNCREGWPLQSQLEQQDVRPTQIQVWNESTVQCTIMEPINDPTKSLVQFNQPDNIITEKIREEPPKIASILTPCEQLIRQKQNIEAIKQKEIASIVPIQESTKSQIYPETESKEAIYTTILNTVKQPIFTYTRPTEQKLEPTINASILKDYLRPQTITLKCRATIYEPVRQSKEDKLKLSTASEQFTFDF